MISNMYISLFRYVCVYTSIYIYTYIITNFFFGLYSFKKENIEDEEFEESRIEFI